MIVLLEFVKVVYEGKSFDICMSPGQAVSSGVTSPTAVALY